MMAFSFKNIRTRLNVWFLLVAMVPLIAVVVIIYQQRVTSIKEMAVDKLVAIRDLKVAEVTNWLTEKRSDMELLANESDLESLKSLMVPGKISTHDSEKVNKVRQKFTNVIKHYSHYSEIFLISAKTGKIIVSSQKNAEGADRSKDPYFTTPLKTQSFFTKDIYYSKSAHTPVLSFSAPVFADDDQDNLIGILVARIDLDQSLYKLLLERPGMGETGETLIVNSDATALNELRWYANAPLNLKISAFPAVQASEGKTGIIESLDYRGKKVLAAYTSIPQVNWGFVAKQDLDEIYRPIKLLIKNCLIIIAGFLGAVFIIAFWVSKGVAAPLITMAAVANRLQSGDYSARNNLMRSDELGSLAGSIDRMAETLTRQMTVQQGVAKIMDSVVASEEISDFANNLLSLFVKITSSDIGAFHILDINQKQYTPAAAIGASSKLLEPVSFMRPSGEIGKAIFLKEICHLKKITRDSFIQLHTFSGKIIPKEVITVPLLNNGEVAAVISLASRSGYSVQHIEIIKTAWIALSTGLANLQTTELTRRLALNLRNTNQELEEQKFELQQQTEELLGQNLKLETQRRQVEEATRLKSEFLSNMSHELRTPLNSIMALSRVLILETQEKLDDEQKKYLEVIARNGKNLLKLINDILDLSKIEAGRMDLNTKMLTVPHVLNTIVEGFEVICQKKGIQIPLDIPEVLPQIECDENRLQQILQNIISNAVKFTLEGSVTITAKSDRDNVIIKVQDTGIGISEKDLPYIFGEFRQADGSSSRRFEGTGLGLAIAKKSAALLNAKITVTSIPGQGTCFTITLPIIWKGPKQPDVKLDKPVTFSPIDPTRKTVLIVDDAPGTAQTIANYLAEAGYNTLTAFSGKEALYIAKAHSLFAITLDIVMPDIDGWEVLQQLKNNPKTSSIPVILVSVSDDQKTGFALGAANFITKPVNRDNLIAALKKLNQTRIKSVMVVDDNTRDRVRIVKMLQEESFNVTEADGGTRCLKLLNKAIPDIIMLDLMMPDMSGFEVLEKLRASSRTRHIPVLTVTARDLTKAEKKLLEKQMAPVIEKNNLNINTFWLKLRDQLKNFEETLPNIPSQEDSVGNKILIVEDNPDTIIQVKLVLEKDGYIVSTASGGPEALEYVKHTIPDGIILDLMMPEIDGFEVLEEIRNTDATAHIPVLILTAKDLSRDELKRLSHNNIQQLVQKGDIDLQGLLFKVELMLGIQPKLSNTSNPDVISPERSTKLIMTNKSISKDKSDKPVILIVEDNPDNVLTIKAILKNQCKLLEAVDGAEGLQKAAQSSPDLILLDMSLPKMDGYEVVRHLKEDAKTSAIPVVALTAQAMKGDREKILAAGCDDYISKPIDPDNIAKCLAKWLSV